MGATPSHNLELLLSRLPLHKQVEMEAILCAYRLKLMGLWKSPHHLSLYDKLCAKTSKHPYFTMPSDWMLKQFSFNANYNTVSFQRAMEGCTGYHWQCTRNLESLLLSEALATLACVNNCLDRGISGKVIRIISDSQAVLKALHRDCFSTKTVWECHNALVRLAGSNRVSLYWVPGHRDIVGNELADQLAEQGSNAPFMGPEPVLCLPCNAVRTTAKNLLMDESYGQWLQSESQRQAKTLNQQPPWLRSKELLNLSRNEIKNGSLKFHLGIHSNKKPYSCAICKKSYFRSESLRKHLKTHTEEKPYSCEICRKSFSISGNLKSHLRIHTKEKPYSCEICKKSFSHSGSLKFHLGIHSNKKPYSCAICKKSYFRSESLRKHLKKHTEEKPYSCEICRKSFSISGNLKSHLRIHTKEKPYSCEICKKSFSHSGEWNSHSNEEPYSCEICKKSYSGSESLRTHLITHTEEKPYSS
ncbi:zinc finger protein 233-like [Uloborus diversus]|uniref:zinc finger protein 233-like n=1 Tax=Uloborus diversus TaxID=327109 RepID=UPI0024096FCB|nr:zinc finger protein 233-like [Uloborus diversus]